MNDTERIDWLERTRSLVNTDGYGNSHVCIGTMDYEQDSRHTHATSYRAAIDAAIIVEAEYQTQLLLQAQA